MIFEEIDDVYDAIMLGLTHDTLMIIGWRHIQSLLAQERPPWAGCRIICVGAWGEDLPDGVLSEEEEEKYYKLASLHSKSDKLGPGHEDSDSGTESFNLYNIIPYILGDVDIRFPKRPPSGLFSEERRVFQEIIDKRYYWWKGWVLMNLSSKQYVTSKAAAKILPSMDATDARCFGQLVLSQICWSSDPDCAMHFIGELNRGDWAGDRFRIVTTDVFKSKTAGEQWKEVSKGTAEWLRDILRSEDEHNNGWY